MCAIFILLYTLCFFMILGGLGMLFGYAFQGNFQLAVAGAACSYFGYWCLKKLPRP